MTMNPFVRACVALPCLAAALMANEVGLDSTGPSRFGAKRVEGAMEFNGDHGVFATFRFDATGEWTVEAKVRLAPGDQATLKGKLGGKPLTEAKVAGAGEAQWINLGTVKALANTPTLLTLDAAERKGKVKLVGYRFSLATDSKATATALPLLHLKTAYTETKEISVGDRGGIGASTIQKAGGRLLVPIVVEKAGTKKMAVRFTGNADAQVTLNIHAIAHLQRDALAKTAKLAVSLAGTGKPSESKDFSLTFEKAGTYLIALEPTAQTGSPLTLNGLLLKDATNADLWALPNGNAQSVHFGYEVPKGVTAVWAYAEAKSAPGPPTTYNCVLGFGQGYFGFQRKSAGTEAKDRVFIYSLWDNGYVKNDAKKVSAEELRNLVTTLTAKGTDVTASAFDHEGSGGHSHLDYAWKDDVSYSFLLGVKADGDAAIFSTWIKLTDAKEWRFLTAFRRPKTVAKLGGLYSFVEDWSGSYGHEKRVCQYANLWVADAAGKWTQLRTAKTSATAELGRQDFEHSVVGNAVVLSTGGYSSTGGKRGVVLTIPAGKAPTLDLAKLLSSPQGEPK